MGSSELAQSLINHELVDEYRLMIHPIVLRTGKRLFREGPRATSLQLIEAATTTTGLVTLAYRPSS